MKHKRLFQNKYKILFFIFYFLFFIFYFSSCTNYKALWVQSQNDLYRCLNGSRKQSELIKPVYVIDESQPAQTDTIYIKDVVITPDSVQRSAFSELPHSWSKVYHHSLNQDSVQVWLTVNNKYQHGVFIQTCKIDSAMYPRKTITITETKEKIIREYNIWKPLAIGIGSGVAVVLIGFFITLRMFYKR